MAQPWKSVRVFISSTFRDMHAERDHLVRFVFPELKDRCRKIHVQLIDVDLRWGVTEADAEEGKALDICLDEIDTCRPYFLGLLGQRYGYIPLGHSHSITAQEIYHGVLHRNVPAQVVDLRKIVEEKLEGRSLTAEQKNCLVHSYQWDPEKSKYLLRADVSHQEKEIIRSIFEKYSIYQRDRSFFFFRNEFLTHKLAGAQLNDFFEEAKEDQDKLTGLKNEIIDAALPWLEYDDLDAFGQLLLDILWKRIEAEAEQAPAEKKDWLKEEAELHELFMADRTRRFVGRRDLLDRMHTFCERDDDPLLLVITGEPGCGKSALMARFTEEALHTHPDWIILPHFVGVSPTSTNLRRMLRRFCTHLNRATGTTEDAPEEIKELLKLFPELLTKAADQQKVLIIIDAVNQLEKVDHADMMHWIPQVLPNQVRFVVSTLAGDARDAMLARRIAPQEEIVSGLTALEIRELVGRYLAEIRHEFPNPQVEETFYQKVEQGNPLYILVALEELRVFGKFEALGRRIEELPGNVAALFDQVLARIESDFTPALVRDCTSYMACGRAGMTAEELQTLLRQHAPPLGPNVEPVKLPDMLWSRVYRSFSSYLFERSGVIDFFHGQLKEAVGKRYLEKEADRKAVHKSIADYFESRWKEPYVRGLGELPHQRIKGKDWAALQHILCDLEFIEAKCAAGMTFDLVADYNSALSSEGLSADQRSAVDDFARFVTAESHLLARNPVFTFQQAANQPDSTRPARAAAIRAQTRLETRIWFRRLNKPRSRSPLLMTLVGHSEAVFGCAFSPDGSRIVSASADRTLKLWDTKTGVELFVLEGHSQPVTACAYSPDGTRIVSASTDETLKLWDAKTGTDIGTLTGHSARVNACTFSPDGNRILSASDDKTLRLWDTETGVELIILQGHESGVNACSFSPDGSRIVSASSDKTVRLWDTKSGLGVATLQGHTDYVAACAFSLDGEHIVSVSGDSTLKIWDANKGTEIAAIKSLSVLLTACAFSPDGSRIISTADMTLKLWDSNTHTELATLKGHSSIVEACTFSPDGNWIVSASTDTTLKLWDAQTGDETATLKAHSTLLMAFAFSPDSSRILSAMKLWDVKTGTEIAAPKSHSDWVNDCDFSPDGSRIVAALDNRTLKLWDVKTGADLATLEGHTSLVNACSFSPDGSRILSASSDTTLKLWDAETGTELATLMGHNEGVSACSFSPDGSRIVSASDDKTLKLWDASTGAELATLQGHTDVVFDCAFSPDGSRIVSASNDGTLRIWDAKTGMQIYEYFVEGRPLSTAWSHNGSLLAAGSANGGVHILRIENLILGPPVLTPWHDSPHLAELAFGCPFCRAWSQISESALGTELPCLHCAKPVKLNPFTICADWRPVALAWANKRKDKG